MPSRFKTVVYSGMMQYGSTGRISITHFGTSIMNANMMLLFKMTWLYEIALHYEIGDSRWDLYGIRSRESHQQVNSSLRFMCQRWWLRVGVSENILKEEKIRMTEPSIGSGGMVIATAKYLKERGINYQKKLKVVGQDLDWLAVYMSYIQLYCLELMRSSFRATL